MTVRAKFRCDSVLNHVAGAVVMMLPVSCGSKENDEFFKYTPSGKLEMGTVNPEAAKQFVPGKTYYLDITEAPE